MKKILTIALLACLLVGCKKEEVENKYRFTVISSYDVYIHYNDVSDTQRRITMTQKYWDYEFSAISVKAYLQVFNSRGEFSAELWKNGALVAEKYVSANDATKMLYITGNY